jgi:hypothetical protein
MYIAAKQQWHNVLADIIIVHRNGKAVRIIGGTVTQLLKVIRDQRPYSVQLLVGNTCMLLSWGLLQDNRIGGSGGSVCQV